MSHIQLEGARLAINVRGDGPETIVFAHGLLWDQRMYEPQIEALSRAYRCVSFDFRGQGDSEVTEAGYDMETLADDAWELCERLGFGPVHWVGLSMGGFVGLRMAAYHPGLIKSLTLLASACDPEPRANVPRYLAMLALVRAMRSSRWVSSRLVDIMLAPSTIADRERAHVVARTREQMSSLDPVGVTRAAMGVIHRRSVAHLLPRISAPTQVVSGAEDRAIAPSRSRSMADRISGASFHTIEGSGHTLSLETPDEVTDAIERFVGAVP